MAVETDGYTIEPSTLENIDVGFYEYINEQLDLHVTSNGGFKKVPIIWSAAERAVSIEHLLLKILHLRDHIKQTMCFHRMVLEDTRTNPQLQVAELFK